MKYSDYAEELSHQLIRLVDKQQAPWQRGYSMKGFEPESYNTARPYAGSNAMKLMLTAVEKGFEDNRWITKNQAMKEGGTVKGKGTEILYFTDEKNVKVKNEKTGEDELKKVKLSRPVLKVSKVFNMEEVDGMEIKKRATPKDLGWKQADLLQNIKDKTKAKVVHAATPAYYPSLDKISLPAPEAYTDERRYASSLIHETTHWTGDDKRLGRDLGNPRGSAGYAREELVAEISTMLIGQKTGIDTNIENNESYVSGWWQPLKSQLEKNPNDIMRICKDAYSARDYILEGKELDRLEKASVAHKIELSDEEKKSGRVDLAIPFSEKNEAKALAKSLGVSLGWDKAGKTWYANVEDGQNIGNLAKFRTTTEENFIDPSKQAKLNGRLSTMAKNWGEYFEKNELNQDEIKTAHELLTVVHKGQSIYSFDEITDKATEGLQVKEDLKEGVHGIERDKQMSKQEQAPQSRKDYPISFAFKDEAKAIAEANDLKFEWDRKGKTWHTTATKEGHEKLNKSLIEAGIMKGEKVATENNNVAEPASTNQKLIDKEESQKVYLNIPFEEKDSLKAEAKSLGMPLKWDGEVKSWHTYKEDLKESFKQYVPDSSNLKREEDPENSIFGAFQKVGAATPPAEIQLDGKFHRLKDATDSRGESSISYKGYNNGVPNALIINHKTGERVKWVGKNPNLTAEERSSLAIINKNNSEAAKVKMEQTRNKVATDSKIEIDKATPAATDHPYLQAKGIQPHNLKQDDKGNILVTLTNTNGEVRSLQRINGEGGKFYAKGGEKNGNFHPFGKLENGKPIVIAEGVATAATIHEVTGTTTVAALDSGNLKDVAQGLSAKYPSSPLIIAADNDHQKPLQSPPRANVGLVKAKEAAVETKATLVVPNVDANDPAERKITDFNDVAKEKGKGEVHKDFSTALNALKVKEAREVLKEEKNGKRSDIQKVDAKKAVAKSPDRDGGR